MRNIHFERSGRDADGPLFDLWVDGRLVERGIPIDAVVERINAFEDLPPATEEEP